MTVSAWWLLAAFWLGGALGGLLIALLAVSKRAEQTDQWETEP